MQVCNLLVGLTLQKAIIKLKTSRVLRSSRSEAFVGTPFSTFSMTIMRMRDDPDRHIVDRWFVQGGNAGNLVNCTSVAASGTWLKSFGCASEVRREERILQRRKRCFVTGRYC